MNFFCQTLALGDLVNALPVLVRWKAEGAEVECRVQVEYFELLQAAGLVSRMANPAGKTYAEAFVCSAELPVQAGKLVRALPNYDAPTPVWEQYAALSGVPAGTMPAYPMSPVPDRVPGSVIVHACGSQLKRMPREFTARVASLLLAAGRVVTVLSGPGDYRGPWPAGAVEAAGKRLKDIPALLAGAEWVVGLDSGITHLAAAVGCRTVAVWGEAPKIWAAPGCAVVERAGATPEEVVARVG